MPGAASLPLLVCATALAPAPARAQQPAPAPPPSRDSAQAPRPGADSARPPVRPVSACARRNDAVPLACILSALRDSAGVRKAFRLTGRKLLAHAERSERAAWTPRTSTEYLRAAFGPQALLRAGTTAGLDQLLGRPHRWPRNGGGFALRFGMRLGADALATGIRYETVRWLNERTAAFEPCTCQRTGARLAHALAAPFRAQTFDGSTHFSGLTPLTELSSGIAFATASGGGLRPRQGLEAGLTGLASMSLMAILREFRPWEKWLAN